MATTEEPATEYEPAVDAQAPEDGPTSQIRPLEPNEFTRRQEGAWSRWEFHIKSKGSKMSRLQRLWILLSFRKRRRSWKKALSASRLRLLVKFALDLAREGGFHYWAVLAIKLVSSFIPAGERPQCVHYNSRLTFSSISRALLRPSSTELRERRQTYHSLWS